MILLSGNWSVQFRSDVYPDLNVGYYMETTLLLSTTSMMLNSLNLTERNHREKRLNEMLKLPLNCSVHMLSFIRSLYRCTEMHVSESSIIHQSCTKSTKQFTTDQVKTQHRQSILYICNIYLGWSPCLRRFCGRMRIFCDRSLES